MANKISQIKVGNTTYDLAIPEGYVYSGVAHIADAAQTPKQNCFKIATEVGTYGGYSSLKVDTGEVAIFKYTASSNTWAKDTTGIGQVTISQNTQTGGVDIKAGGSILGSVASVKDVFELEFRIQGFDGLKVENGFLNVQRINASSTSKFINIPVNGGDTIFIKAPNDGNIYYYVVKDASSAGADISWATGYSERSDLPATYTRTIVMPDDAGFMTMMIKSSGVDVMPVEFTINGKDALLGIRQLTDMLADEIPSIKSDVDAIKEYIDGGDKVQTFGSEYFTTNAYVNSNGEIATSNNWRCTDYIPCEGVSYIKANCLLDHNYGSKGIAFFDVNKNYLLGYPLEAGGGDLHNVIGEFGDGTSNPIPDGTAYVKCGSHTSYVSSAYLELTSYAPSVEEKINIIKGESAKNKTDIANTRKGLISDGVRPLKIFFLGNSFAVQSVEYLAKICQSNGFKITIGVSYVGGATLQAYDQYYGKSKESTTLNPYQKYKNGEWIYSGEDHNINIYDKLTDEDWDVLSIQQGSASADSYATYQPYAQNLIDWFNKEMQYSGGKAAYLIPWAWSDDRLQSYTTAGDSTTHDQMYDGIIGATRELKSDIPFGVIYPVGVAIENLYLLGYTTNDILSSDGLHLGSEIAKFTAGYCLFRVLMPMYYKDIDIASITYTDDNITQSMFLEAKSAVESALNG